ncbi:MAG: hypothetical protein ABFE13_11540 [Phycisphaerales bacterium]
MFYSIDDIKSRNRARGHHFFEPGTMRFFRSRVLDGVEGGRFFITSERFVASDGSSPGRRYTVRYCDAIAAEFGVSDWESFMPKAWHQIRAALAKAKP